MRRALLKPEASGPEAIKPDSFGGSRDGPSKPERRVLVFSSTEIITGARRGLSYPVETMVDHGFGESWLVGSCVILVVESNRDFGFPKKSTGENRRLFIYLFFDQNSPQK
jgi:hypothetical protein